MKMQPLALIAVVFLAGADAGKDDAAKKEIDKFQGTWVVVSAEREGQPLDDIKDDKVTFSGDKMTIKTKMRDQEGTFKLDPTKKPKAIDIKPSEGSEKGQTIQGIYSLEGDRLKFCFARDGKERPSEFATKAGSGLMMVELKRAKP
jgi:uncharacterized protein (TIGR03067 family)